MIDSSVDDRHERRAPVRALATGLAALLLVGLLTTSIVAAQSEPSSESPDEPSASTEEVVHADADAVDDIVVALWVIAGAMTLATGTYWWKTRPAVRMRRHQARRAREAGEALFDHSTAATAVDVEAMVEEIGSHGG